MYILESNIHKPMEKKFNFFTLPAIQIERYILMHSSLYLHQRLCVTV